MLHRKFPPRCVPHGFFFHFNPTTAPPTPSHEYSSLHDQAGWPKFVGRMLGVSTADSGIAVSMLGPVSAKLVLSNITTVAVNVTTVRDGSTAPLA